jgi:hypothetical protein
MKYFFIIVTSFFKTENTCQKFPGNRFFTAGLRNGAP